MKVVIVGLGTAGFSAILAIKKLDKEAEITVIDKKNFDLQHSCGLPYVLEGHVKIEDLEHDIGAANMKVNVLFFGILTDIVKTSSMQIEDVENIRQLKSWLWKNYPQTKDMDFQIALNKNIVDGKHELNDGDEIALLPPFAGG